MRRRPMMDRIPKRARRAVLLSILMFGSVFSYLFISNLVFGYVQVSGESMLPTLHGGETYVLQRWMYAYGDPDRTHIVALRDPLDDGLSVKRIIGLPGDAVSLADGAVVVNGTELIEAYLPESMKTIQMTPEGAHFRLAPNEYFVLGDNRQNSIDSRIYGPVTRDRILGPIVP